MHRLRSAPVVTVHALSDGGGLHHAILFSAHCLINCDPQLFQRIPRREGDKTLSICVAAFPRRSTWANPQLEADLAYAAIFSSAYIIKYCVLVDMFVASLTQFGHSAVIIKSISLHQLVCDAEDRMLLGF